MLVDAGSIFLSDLLGLGGELQRSYRQGYALDQRNSAVTGVRGQPGLLVLETNNHFATGNIAVPPLNDATLQARLTDAQMARAISLGKGAMPPFMQELDRDSLAGVIAYIRTLKH